MIDAEAFEPRADSETAPPDSGTLQALETVLGGGRIGRVRPLPGGLAARMHAFDYTAPSAETQSLVLRRYGRGSRRANPEAVARCWSILTALAGTPVPAPQPIWLDRDHSIFAEPALVMSYIPGTAELPRRVDPTWIAELAGPSPPCIERRLIRQQVRQFHSWTSGARCSPKQRTNLQGHPLTERVLTSLQQWSRGRRRNPLALIHGDYWAGNTLWQNGRLVAIVDWDDGGIGEAAWDVSYCRMDLAMMLGDPAPSLFLQCYEDAVGSIRDLAAWDLLAAVRALPNPGRWLPGYHDLGRQDIGEDDMRTRLDAFIESALQQPSSS